MSIYQEVADFDEIFACLSNTPIILNDLNDASMEDKELNKKILTTNYSSDMVNLIPKCECGKFSGDYSYGVKCDVCGTEVCSEVDDDLAPIVWFRAPIGVKKLINPVIWIMLRKRFSIANFDVMQWLTSSSYEVVKERPVLLQKLLNSNIPRSYNNFVDNFDEIMDFLFSLHEFKIVKNKIDHLKELINQNRDKVFSQYIPVPNKCLLVIEKTNTSIMVDPKIIDAMNAIQPMISIDKDFYNQKQSVKENRTIKSLTKLSDFYNGYVFGRLGGKKGQFRKHIFGMRTVFSFRAVISSLIYDHEYDEIHVPWGIGLTVFRPHVINKLIKKGYSLNSSIGYIHGHINQHCDMLKGILQELIDESNNRLFVLIGRNPTLMQGSILRVRIAKFKDGPKGNNSQYDTTVSFPIELVTAPNADFDGDELNGTVAIDIELGNLWYPLSPKFNLTSLDKPNKINRNISLPKPVCMSLARWIKE